jgi:rhamnose utilization protein RhaD (predicted bifunctional aldolase and dehydrogenase)
MLVPSKGVLVADNFDRAARELLIGLKRVVERIDPNTTLQYLTGKQVSNLLNWDAEKYRIAMAKQYDALSHHDIH